MKITPESIYGYKLQYIYIKSFGALNSTYLPRTGSLEAIEPKHIPIPLPKHISTCQLRDAILTHDHLIDGSTHKVTVLDIFFADMVRPEFPVNLTSQLLHVWILNEVAVHGSEVNLTKIFTTHAHEAH